MVVKERNRGRGVCRQDKTSTAASRERSAGERCTSTAASTARGGDERTTTPVREERLGSRGRNSRSAVKLELGVDVIAHAPVTLATTLAPISRWNRLQWTRRRAHRRITEPADGELNERRGRAKVGCGPLLEWNVLEKQYARRANTIPCGETEGRVAIVLVRRVMNGDLGVAADVDRGVQGESDTA